MVDDCLVWHSRERAEGGGTLCLVLLVTLLQLYYDRSFVGAFKLAKPFTRIVQGNPSPEYGSFQPFGFGHVAVHNVVLDFYFLHWLLLSDLVLGLVV